jgi:hypothetical protein
VAKEQIVLMSLYASKGFHNDILLIWDKAQRKKARAILIALAEDARRTGSIDFEDYFNRLASSEIDPGPQKRIDLYVDAIKYPDLVDLWNRTLQGTRSSTFLMMIQGAINKAKSGRGLSILSLAPTNDIVVTSPARTINPQQASGGSKKHSRDVNEATLDLFQENQKEESFMDSLVNNWT